MLRKIDKMKEEQVIKQEFEDFIIAENHPCMMAQSVFQSGNAGIHIYDEFATETTAKEILKDLKKYLAGYDFESNEFFSFIAIFKNENEFSEKEYETKLWQQLQLLHDFDEEPWDETVSSDPQDPNFSFSLLGRSFYMVGMHPNSSRFARSAPYTCMVFNLHWQFEKLREMGAYDTVRNKIRERDEELQGSINPMLEDFGEESEAKQYSGRKTEKDWKCPFAH